MNTQKLIQSFQRHILTYSQILILYKSYQWAINLGKLDPSTPNHVEKHA